ncbi:PREDICTED: TITAN-like protein [Fragaria vesca subsp. vesca]|uniref:TITAN-like protein n=1 Tax=Fragaria vesca subsp. vesca TaxID=101020 RepID=UPI0002C2E2D4|nr:PREDICTED: TITAN-like protein [Fragaria vesca subsp. vesca]
MKKTKTKKKKHEFEYCTVCKLNHDQGPSHKYIPSHTKSLSTFLSRFQAKLSDVVFFLNNPTFLRLEHAARNRLWCVFCDFDIDERDSSFACGNAINHLASAEHLKNLKHFLWKYGGGMDSVDKFRILEADLAKWEKKCKALKTEAVSGGPMPGPSNDIHTKLEYGILDTFQNSSSSKFSNGVMPLLDHTNENQVSHSVPSQYANGGCFVQDVVASSSINSQGFTVSSQGSLISNGRKGSADVNLNNERMNKVYQHGRMAMGQSSSQGVHSLTQIPYKGPKDASGNVHTGALPPWFAAEEEIQLSIPLQRVSATPLPLSNQAGKSKKLNPKRVGAAWAERRKREMEMEQRGEIVKNDYDANWLPNFGGVWQSGTRKEARKEFELEKHNLVKVESQSEMPIKIQPYVSKRMRTGASE